MNQLDGRLRNAAAGLRAATAEWPIPTVPADLPRRRRATASVLATAAVVAAILAGTLLVLVDDHPPAVTRPSSSGLNVGHAPLLPADLTLPTDWRVARSDPRMAVVRGSGAVSRIVVWQPSTVVDPDTGTLVPAPYAVAGFFYGHPDLRVVSAKGTWLGRRRMQGADVRVKASAGRCGTARCVPLTAGARPLRLRSGHAVRAYFGTAYGFPLVVLVESATGSLTGALKAAKPILAQLR